LASGRDAEGKAWLADVCLAGGGPFQTAARLGKLDAVKCMVEELGFDVDAGSQQGMYVCASSVKRVYFAICVCYPFCQMRYEYIGSVFM
jgi:hypothetical protein